MSSGRQFARILVVWTLSGILGLTVALLAVGLLGLWVAVGAIAGLARTFVAGLLGQILFATDYDALLARRAAQATARDKLS